MPARPWRKHKRRWRLEPRINVRTRLCAKRLSAAIIRMFLCGISRRGSRNLACPALALFCICRLGSRMNTKSGTVELQIGNTDCTTRLDFGTLTSLLIRGNDFARAVVVDADRPFPWALPAILVVENLVILLLRHLVHICPLIHLQRDVCGIPSGNGCGCGRSG